MARPTCSIGALKHVEQNLNKLDASESNKNPTSISQNQTTPPSYRNITKNNEIIVYSAIQWKEDKYRAEEDSSSIVESSSFSSEEANGELNHSDLETTLNLKPASTQKGNRRPLSNVFSIRFFENMPLDVIRKILIGDDINFNNISKAAKNMMAFAAISKFNRECVRNLLTEEGLHEVSFEITKSVIPKSLTKLVNDKKEKVIHADIDSLVHDWPYMTLDCSYKKYTFTNKAVDALKQIVHHPELKKIRIVNNLPEKISEWNETTIVCNRNGPELIYELLSRKKIDPVEIDFTYNNWVPSLYSKAKINDKSLDLIKKIQDRADKCDSVSFGEIILSRNYSSSSSLFGSHQDSRSFRNRKYQFKFVKVMCNIALSHSVHTISLAGLNFSDEEIGLIINEIRECDKASLLHLNLSENHINEHGVKSISAWLQSDMTCIKTLNLNNTNMHNNELSIIYEALKNNHSLEVLEIKTMSNLPDDHPIREDKRVKISGFFHWI